MFNLTIFTTATAAQFMLLKLQIIVINPEIRTKFEIFVIFWRHINLRQQNILEEKLTTTFIFYRIPRI